MVLNEWLIFKDEIQARFQAQIQLLESEVERRDQVISQLQLQLHSLGVQPVSPVRPQSDREEQTTSVESDEEDDDDSGTLRYFAVSFTKLDLPLPCS